MRNVWMALTVGFAVAVSALAAPSPSGSVRAAGWHQVSGPIRAGLRVGDRGMPVRTLQGDLWQLGLNPGVVDGRFGSQTQAALKKFQAGEGLPSSGNVDQATFDRLAARVLASLPLRGWLIVVDPGHGGGNGTPPQFAGAKREDVNTYDISVRLRQLLEADGAQVLMTRPAGRNASYHGLSQLPARTTLANDSGADLFISIHQNDYPSSSAVRGSTVFYSGGSSRTSALAWLVEHRISTYTGLQDHGIEDYPYYVLRNTQMPAILVEGGFLSNRAEARLISTGRFHQAEAHAVELGVLDYAREYPKR